MTIACQDECLKTIREVTVQLRMMKWGYLGPAETTAGQYLAYHRAEIGQYFSTSINNQWPYQPLHRGPNDFEIRLNDMLTKLTNVLSHGLVSGVSILDLRL